MEIASYNDGSNVISADNGSPDYTRISPSQVANFFSSTRQWYGETLMGEPGFSGNDSTHLGTIVHFFCELAAKGIRLPDPAATVSAYLDQQVLDNRSEIESLWRDMANTMIAGCINGKPKPTYTEHFMFHKLLPSIYVAGTCDAIVPLSLGDGTVAIVDYKTASTKPAGSPYHYRMQAHTYAYLATQQGMHVSEIRLQYVTRPTKTLPCRHFEFKEPFTSEDYDRIEGQLKLIANSIQHWHKHPEHRYLLAQDYRLYTPPKLQIFKD